jgi:hypothetical protein
VEIGETQIRPGAGGAGHPRQLGVVLTPAEVQDEGLDRVLDNIVAAGATAISPTLGVYAPARNGEGSREPPLDVSGEARLLDRPLWGRRELWMRGYTPHPPDPSIWADVPYAPPPLAPPELRIDVVRAIVDGARVRGLAVEIQVSPYTLPGAPGGQTFGSGHGTGLVDDRPRRIDGSVGERIVAGHGCLNNPRVRGLGRARLREALRHYPDVDGIFLDWTEYTCYFLEDCFTCFCDYCRVAAEQRGYDWSRIQRDTCALWDRLHHLTADDLACATTAMDNSGWPFTLLERSGLLSGVADLLRFKVDSVQEAAAELRRTMDEAGASGVALGLNGFAPPWSQITGMEYRRVHEVVQATRCKLFTFHWPMIVNWWSSSLLDWNPDLDEQAVLRAVQTALDLSPPPGEHRRALADYRMPRPEEPHPVTPGVLTRKIDQAIHQAGSPRCLAYVHSYRPAAEFAQVLEAVLASEAAGCWVQRYGYLSDEKLAIMRSVWRA